MKNFEMEGLNYPNRPAVIAKLIVAEQKDFTVDNFVVQNGRVNQLFFFFFFLNLTMESKLGAKQCGCPLEEIKWTFPKISFRVMPTFM